MLLSMLSTKTTPLDKRSVSSVPSARQCRDGHFGVKDLGSVSRIYGWGLGFRDLGFGLSGLRPHTGCFQGCYKGIPKGFYRFSRCKGTRVFRVTFLDPFLEGCRAILGTYKRDPNVEGYAHVVGLMSGHLLIQHNKSCDAKCHTFRLSKSLSEPFFPPFFCAGQFPIRKPFYS